MSILGTYLRIPAVHIAALTYLIVSLILTQIPLGNYLGYEFSASIGVCASLISGLLTIHFFSDHRFKPLTRKTWLQVIGDYILVNTVLLFIPLIIISLNAFVVKNCSFSRGLQYYALIPFFTMVFSVSLALVLSLVTKKTRLVYIAVLIFILLDILRITYTQPQLFAYNPLLGFFPGITYDETLSDLSHLLLYREFTAAAALLFLILFFIGIHPFQKKGEALTFKELFRVRAKDGILWIGAVFCTLLLLYEIFFSASLGFEYSESEIQRALGRQTLSEHFVFYYSSDAYSVESIKLLKRKAEYHYLLVSERLHTHAEPKKIAVYIYPTSAEKQRYIGTTTTNIAKPWKQELHITSDSFESTFRHELVHVLAAEFGIPLFHASPYMVFNEGLAVAVDWSEGLYSAHQYVAALQREKKLGDVSSLFTFTGFARMPSSYAYLVAGSFSKYLIDRYGIEPYKKIFSYESVYVVYGQPLDALLADWKLFLKTIDTSELSSETIHTIFSQQSIFTKMCAREIAERTNNGFKALRNGNFSEADSLLRSSFEEGGSISGLRGLLQSLMMQRKPQAVVQTYAELSSALQQHPAVRLLAGDAHAALGNSDSAMKLYVSVERLQLSESYIEATALRKAMLMEAVPDSLIYSLRYTTVADSVRKTQLQKIVEEFPHASVPQFVLGEIYLNLEDTQNAIKMFENANNHATLRELHYFSLMNLAELSFQACNFEKAKMYLWMAKNYVPAENLNKKINALFDVWDYVEYTID